MLKDSEHYTFRHQFDGKPGITLHYFVFRNLAKEYNHWEFSRAAAFVNFALPILKNTACRQPKRQCAH